MLNRQNRVRPMAITTTGGAGSTKRVAGPVNTGGIPSRRVFMAGGTIDRFGSYIIVGMFLGDIRAATGTGIGFVNAGSQFGFVHEQRYSDAGRVRFVESFVGMAVEASAVRDGRGLG